MEEYVRTYVIVLVIAYVLYIQLEISFNVQFIQNIYISHLYCITRYNNIISRQARICSAFGQ